MARASGGWDIRGEILTREEAQALLRSCNKGATGARNRAFLGVLWRGGLRTFEALALTVADLDRDRGVVYVRRGKGGRPDHPKDRWVGLDDHAFALIEVWLVKRRAHGLGSKHRVFLTLQGAPLSARYCRDMVKRVAARAGIRRRVHLHGLRHAHAVEQVREGATLPEVQKQLGHESIATTNTYLAHVTPEDLAARARARPGWTDDDETSDASRPGGS